MNYPHVIGIDVSKRTLDFCLLMEDGTIAFTQSANEPTALRIALCQLCTDYQIDFRQTLLCAEHTSRYGKPLIKVALHQQWSLWMEHPTQIKHSQGIQRGKDDRQDAQRIAQYARRFQDKALLVTIEDPVYEQLAYLCAERDLLVADRAKYQAQLKDEKAFVTKNWYQQKTQRYQKLLVQLTQAIAQIEAQLDQLIQQHSTLQRHYTILTSIDGIGPQVAVQTIIATKGFTKFTEARKFSCHVGCAPFQYRSGSSVRSRNKVSHRADKKLKQLYHMAALSAIRTNATLKAYFERKVVEGKNKMSVINAVRSKLITIIFALIRDDRKYEKNYIPQLD